MLFRPRVVVAALSTVLLLGCGGLFEPGPWHGDAQFVLTLQGSGPTAGEDGAILGARLRDQGATVEVTELSDTSLRLEVSTVRGSDVVPLILPRYQLEISNEHGLLRNEDVAAASVGVSEYGGGPYVLVEFTEAGGAAFCELSKASRGEAIDLVVDGVVVSSPVVRDPICGGSLHIELGSSGTTRGGGQEAAALARGLSSTPLASEWTVETLSE